MKTTRLTRSSTASFNVGKRGAVPRCRKIGAEVTLRRLPRVAQLTRSGLHVVRERDQVFAPPGAAERRDNRRIAALGGKERILDRVHPHPVGAERREVRRGEARRAGDLLFDAIRADDLPVDARRRPQAFGGTKAKCFGPLPGDVQRAPSLLRSHERRTGGRRDQSVDPRAERGRGRGEITVARNDHHRCETGEHRAPCAGARTEKVGRRRRGAKPALRLYR